MNVDPPILLVWTAPDGCPTVEELRAEIRRLAGSVTTPAELPEARANVRRGSRDTWLLTLTTKSGAQEGERRLVAADCAQLMRTAALVLALMINPNAGTPAPPPPPALPPPPVVVTPQLPPPAAAGPLMLGVAAFTAGGVLPGDLAPGLGLRAGWGSGLLSIELRGNLWRSRRIASAVDASSGGSFNLVDLEGGLCATKRRAHRLSPGVCGGPVVLRSRGEGYGVSDPGSATAWWSGVFAEAHVRFHPTPSQALRVAAEALVPFGRPSFALAGAGTVTVWRPAAFGARATVGWELQF